MDLLKILGICVLVAGLSGCRKKSDSRAAEVREAGYEMTAEGWFDAIRDNDVAVMRKMVDGGFDDKTLDSEGNSGLHLAAGSGSQAVGEYLLNRGHSVDVVGANGRTPLMSAVLADRPAMVKWLLRQGADPKLKDGSGFMALMLAASDGKMASVEELAPYHREDLDAALLLASLVGKAEVIDVLTNYGASVYARMEDGRTPLMLAAENGHKQAAALLVDIGASRFATTESGDTALSLAVAAGHTEIVQLIETGFAGDSLAFETDEEVAEAMNEALEDFQPEPEEGLVALNEEADGVGLTQNDDPRSFDTVADGEVAGGNANESASGGSAAGTQDGATAALGAAQGGITEREVVSKRTMAREPVKNLSGAMVSAKAEPTTAKKVAIPGLETTGITGTAAAPVEKLPLVMRQFRQRELPVVVKQVSGGVASLHIPSVQPRDVQVKAGEKIPGSDIIVIRVFSRVEQGKLNNAQPLEVGIVEVEDSDTGLRREWIAGSPASAHDPVALVEDAATGQRYVAKPGQKFTSEDGREFVISDVRPSQLVIEDVESGQVRTLPLRGPKG